MKPARFEARPATRLLGIRRRLDPYATNWPALWQEEYMPRMPEIDARTTGNTCFGAYFGSDVDGLVDLVAGRPVRDGVDVPEGLIVRELPTATYAVFECTISGIAATWHAIYDAWLPDSDYAIDDGKACFEEFAEGCHEGTIPVRILVPVVRRVQPQQ